VDKALATDVYRIDADIHNLAFLHFEFAGEDSQVLLNGGFGVNHQVIFKVLQSGCLLCRFRSLRGTSEGSGRLGFEVAQLFEDFVAVLARLQTAFLLDDAEETVKGLSRSCSQNQVPHHLLLFRRNKRGKHFHHHIHLLVHFLCDFVDRTEGFVRSIHPKSRVDGKGELEFRTPFLV
jgi:hypothetical protein